MARKTLRVPADGFRSIAVLRLSSLGDVILTLPVVRALARAYPNARIHYWTKEEYAEVVRHDPAIAHVRALERDARRLEDLVSMAAELEDADLIVDLHGNTRTRLLTFRQKAPVLRAPAFRLRRVAQVRARALRPTPAVRRRAGAAGSRGERCAAGERAGRGGDLGRDLAGGMDRRRAAGGAAPRCSSFHQALARGALGGAARWPPLERTRRRVLLDRGGEECVPRNGRASGSRAAREMVHRVLAADRRGAVASFRRRVVRQRSDAPGCSARRASSRALRQHRSRARIRSGRRRPRSPMPARAVSAVHATWPGVVPEGPLPLHAADHRRAGARGAALVGRESQDHARRGRKSQPSLNRLFLTEFGGGIVPSP